MGQGLCQCQEPSRRGYLGPLPPRPPASRQPEAPPTRRSKQQNLLKLEILCITGRSRDSSTRKTCKLSLNSSIETRDKISENHLRIRQIRTMRDSINKESWRKFAAWMTWTSWTRLGGEINAELTAVRKSYQTKNESGRTPLNFPIRLNNRLAALAKVWSRITGDYAPRISRRSPCEINLVVLITTVNWRSCGRSLRSESPSSTRWSKDRRNPSGQHGAMKLAAAGRLSPLIDWASNANLSKAKARRSCGRGLVFCYR